ncbi:uncharacterized protein LOC124286061 isoform X1 [Haliotis rubra]|uniref:uncharacterized protein LOC124286061 isoform X1 n=1 Tax=Haliotis rubra TaxID=36100 RepID=UPI001EE52273|nr:uncharacterized protein LOC124286061 isoform X1 [Haliotis rubra]
MARGLFCPSVHFLYFYMDQGRSKDYLQWWTPWNDQSVGLLHHPQQIGTAFRVGSQYVMTARHLFTRYQIHGNLSAMLLKSFVQFDKQKFYLKGIELENEEHDVIVFELDVPKGHQLPPPLPLMSRDQHVTNKVTILGFDGYGKKVVDNNCPTIQVSEKECRMARQDLQKMGFRANWYNGNRYSGDWYNDLAHPHLLPLKTHLAHGASGSPVVVQYEGKPLVIAMFIKGYPEFYWDLDDTYKRRIDEKFIIKAAVKLSTIDMDFIADDIMDRS